MLKFFPRTLIAVSALAAIILFSTNAIARNHELPGSKSCVQQALTDENNLKKSLFSSDPGDILLAEANTDKSQRKRGLSRAKEQAAEPAKEKGLERAQKRAPQAVSPPARDKVPSPVRP